MKGEYHEENKISCFSCCVFYLDCSFVGYCICFRIAIHWYYLISFHDEYKLHYSIGTI